MRQRSSYPKPFKTQVVQVCLQPSAFIACVALSHGINANVVKVLGALGACHLPLAYKLHAEVPL